MVFKEDYAPVLVEKVRWILKCIAVETLYSGQTVLILERWPYFRG